MKLLGLVALIAGAHAAANTDEYLYLKTYGALKAAGGSATNCSGSPGALGATFLLKPIRGDGTELTALTSLAAYCVSYPATFEMAAGTDSARSMLITDDAAAGVYKVQNFGTPFCHNIIKEASVANTTWFASLVSHGDNNCGGTSGAANGIIVLTGGSSCAMEASATLIKTKSMFGFQLQGPFTDTLCVSNTNNVNQFPHAIPLEDTAVAGFIQSTTTAGTCNDWSLAAASNKYTTQVLKSSTAGDIIIRIRSGAGSTSACASGALVHNVTFSADARGRFARCVQAKDHTTSAVVSSGYYLLTLDDASAGIWPNIKEFPTTAPGAVTPSPASTMHVSAALAAALALIAALM